MAVREKKITDKEVRNWLAKDKPYKKSIGDGLFLYIVSDTKKYWRFKYRFNGKEKLLAFGVYPEVSLAMARDKCFEARALLRNDIDPAEHRKEMKKVALDQTENCFEAVAREWFVKYSSSWVPSHADKIIKRLERDIFPWLGKKSFSEITPPVLLSVVRRVENRGALETAHRALSNCGQIFRYAVATGRAERDNSQDLRGALPPVKVKHFAAQTDPKRLGELLGIFDEYSVLKFK